MVATSRTRKPNQVEGEQICSYNQRGADGRRQLLGLSQAIREKAFQSRSPTSEAKHAQKFKFGHPLKTSPAKDESKEIPSIEERLKNLFNSDTEGVVDDYKSKKKSSIVSPVRPRCKTTSSKPTEASYANTYISTYVKPNTTEKPVVTQSKPANRSYDSFINSNTLDNRKATDSNSSKTDSGISVREWASIRRCKSAVPPSFYDRDEHPANCMEEPPKYKGPQLRHRTPSPVIKPWESKRSSSPADYPCAAPRSISTPGLNLSSYQRESTIAPTVSRRSLFNENDAGRQADPSASRTASAIRLTRPARTAPDAPHQNPGQPPRFNHSTPLTNQQKFRKSYGQVQSGLGTHNASHRQSNAPEPPLYVNLSPNNAYDRQSNSTSYRPCQNPKMPNQNNPTPNRRSVYSVPQSNNIHDEHNRNGSSEQSRDIRCVTPAPKQQSHSAIHSPDFYPQQNFSFRRAVHNSVSDDHDAAKQTTPSPEKSQPLDSDRGPRKSDDRDSGTVLEPEASVFDFDSDVLSEHELDDEKSRNAKEAWSRSSTPMLPPLSSGEESVDVACQVKVSQHDVIHHSQDDVVRLRSGKPQGKVKPLRHSDVMPADEYIDMDSNAKGLVVETKTCQQKYPNKVISTKLQRGASTVRRGFHPKNASGDERGRRKSYHHDDDVIEDSPKQPGYALQPKRNQYQSAYYQRNHISRVARSEYGETSSVRSVTTTSVCSSVLRRSRRYRSKRHVAGASNGEICNREIRSVNKRFTRLEGYVVTLAQSLAQLSSELRQQNVTSREIEELRQEVQQIRSRQLMISTPPSKGKKSSHKSEKTPPKIATRIGKFFGEQQPLLNVFLKQLGYEKYIKNFQCESIGMMELPYMDESRLRAIGIPLGPRLRILKEAQKSSYV